MHSALLQTIHGGDPSFFPPFYKKKRNILSFAPRKYIAATLLSALFLKISFETYIMPSAPIEDRINGELLIITSQKKIQ